MVGFRAVRSCSERGLPVYTRGFPLGGAALQMRWAAGGQAAFQPQILSAAESGARGVGLRPGPARLCGGAAKGSPLADRKPNCSPALRRLSCLGLPPSRPPPTCNTGGPVPSEPRRGERSLRP